VGLVELDFEAVLVGADGIEVVVEVSRVDGETVVAT
jgi:hypothetical protein